MTGSRRGGERLAFHLISAHCDGMAITRSWGENVEQHVYEHRGPGTIRDHDLPVLCYDAEKIELVLAGLEEMLGIAPEH